MRIPIGRVTRDYLIAHKLAPIQCAPNVFRILNSVDALNEKIGVTSPITMLIGFTTVIN